jgi:CBS domain-containing protein
MQLKDVMTTNVTLTDPRTTLQAAAAAMRDGDFGVLPVGENDRLVGIITDRDIAVRAVADGKDPRSATVREAMSEGVTWCFEDQSTDEAAAVMSREQIRRLPVLNRDKRLVGIVALGDFAVASGTIEEAAKALHNVSKD